MARKVKALRIHSIRGNSAIELMAVIVLILGVLLTFGGYITNGFVGHMKAAGDAVGQGKQYDPRGFGASGENGGTLDCFQDKTVGDSTYNQWIDEACYRQNNCDCTLVDYKGDPLGTDYNDHCVACKQGCIDSRCQ